MNSRSDTIERKLNRRNFIRSTAFGFLGTLLFFRVNLARGRKLEQAQNNSLHDEKKSTGERPEGFKFFNDHQRALVSDIAALIVSLEPDQTELADQMVSDIDRWVYESKSKKKKYTIGLNWIDAFSRNDYGADEGFLGLKESQKMDLLERMSESSEVRLRRVQNIWQRINRKLGKIWDNIFGVGRQSLFFAEIRKDAIGSYYSKAPVWFEVGYFGPPQPVGYPHFNQPPENVNHSDSARTVGNSTCLNCHETGRHSRGGIINLSCTNCHRPHSPWLYDEDQPRLEDQFGVIFPNPDKKP
jgi:hypothetical protein